MEYKRIEEFTTVVTGGTPSTAKSEYWDGGVIPWLQSGCCQNCDVDKTEKYITQEGYDNSSTRMMPLNTVMIALTGATAGKVGYLKFEACGNQSITGILPCDSINQRYLFYYLLSQREKILTDCVGGAQAHISQGYVKNIKVPVLSLSEQEKIVEVLTKLSDVISKRQGEINALDNLIKARFVEMFGDVKINPHKYKKNSIKSVLKTCEAGWSGNGTQRIRKDDEIAVLKVSAVTKGYFIPEECKVLDDQENIKKYVTPEKGDLLFSRANTREMVGATAIVKEDYPSLILPDKLWKIKFRDNVNVFYMKYVLSSKSVRNQFSVVSTGTSGSMYNVSMDKFKAIEVPLPPIELQNQFADFVNQVDKSKVAVQKALDETQLLFDSLMQEYFG